MIEFSYSGGKEDGPGLMVNRADLEDARTVVDGQEQGVSLKSYYVYKLDYYPLVFDLCTALFIFMGTFLLSEKKRGKGNAPFGAPGEGKASIPFHAEKGGAHE